VGPGGPTASTYVRHWFSTYGTTTSSDATDSYSGWRFALGKRENFLFGPENNALFLFNTETENISYMSSTRVFLFYLTLLSVWVANSVKFYVKSLFYP
jgi:hypothetical protein